MASCYSEKESWRLEATYGIKPTSVWSEGFYAPLDTETRDLLRCEPLATS